MPRLARFAVVLLLLLPLSCAGPLEEGRPLRLEGDSTPLSASDARTVVFLPQPGRKPVPISREEFEAAVELGWMMAEGRLADSSPVRGRLALASWQDPGPAMSPAVASTSTRRSASPWRSTSRSGECTTNCWRRSGTRPTRRRLRCWPAPASPPTS
jgi:hypothetical protein